MDDVTEAGSIEVPRRPPGASIATEAATPRNAPAMRPALAGELGAVTLLPAEMVVVVWPTPTECPAEPASDRGSAVTLPMGASKLRLVGWNAGMECRWASGWERAGVLVAPRSGCDAAGGGGAEGRSKRPRAVSTSSGTSPKTAQQQHAVHDSSVKRR